MVFNKNVIYNINFITKTLKNVITNPRFEFLSEKMKYEKTIV